jgi:hypothetical protein
MNVDKVIEGMAMKGKVSFTVRPAATQWQSTNHRVLEAAKRKINRNRKALGRSSILQIKEDGQVQAVIYIK